MEILQPNQHEALRENFIEPQNFRTSIGGHMAYRRVLFDDANGDTYFVKAYDPALIPEEWRQAEMAYFLEKESRVYQHLESHAYVHAPKLELYSERMLVLRGLTTKRGWHWRLPKNPDFQDRYKLDVLAAFENLETIPMLAHTQEDEISVDTFYNFGWDKLHDIDVPLLIARNLNRWSSSLHSETPEEAELLLDDMTNLMVKRVDMNRNVLNHHDARQSNIAWHPEFGARIVDWSWADGGMQSGDATMFIMDLHKADHNIKKETPLISPVYAKMMLGYWLQRSQTAHMEGNDDVRMHQFVSAIKAASLLKEIQ